MSENTEGTFKWRRPQEVMQLHKLKKKKKALQARMNATAKSNSDQDLKSNLESIMVASKRKNPFLSSSENKRTCRESVNTDPEESGDQTLFKLFHLTNVAKTPLKQIEPVSYENEYNKSQVEERVEREQLVKVVGEKWIPVDWTLKTKLRFMSEKPFSWNQKLKISEEASGVTSFSRCLNISSTTTSLDTSPNAQFHQCCLYWQQPCLPWLSLFPRTVGRASEAGSSIATTQHIRDSLQGAWADGLRSLYQLIRTRQCPYFYACANTFTVLFRAAGLAGFSEVHALVTPTTRGLRALLKQEDIEFTMPLKKLHKIKKDMPEETAKTTTSESNNDDDADEEWMQSMGINSEDIKQINYTQARIAQKSECEIDNSDQSLVFIEGLEVQALYNFLINCKSTISLTGHLAGIPPTLLAPVAFTGASLNALKIRESKVHVDNDSYYSLDVSGPILPNTIHNLCAIHPKTHSLTATFSNVELTAPFSEVKVANISSSEDSVQKRDGEGSAVFRKENLSDCGLPQNVLKHFCSENVRHVANIECLKYTAENSSYAWS